MCHVLVIEDDPWIAEYVGELALAAGATSLDEAVTPLQAIACAVAHPPALILSDVQIVDGTGPEAVIEIRKRVGPVPVIFITGTPDPCASIEEPVVVLTKPVDEALVIGAFHRLRPPNAEAAPRTEYRPRCKS